MVSDNLTALADEAGRGEDIVANFQIDNQPVRGRICHMGRATLNEILGRHDYPLEAARLMGEALLLAALVGSSLKIEGRLSVQAEGDGPIRLMVAEYTTNGQIRGMLRVDQERWDKLMTINKGGRPHPQQAFGKSVFAMTILHDDPDMRPYQAVVPLSGRTLAECAEAYFLQSEQIPTRVRLAVGQATIPGKTPIWQGGGALIQQVAPDEARGATEDAWTTASILFETVTDAELIDPDLSAGRVLFRLFHETGVRMEPPVDLVDRCTCSAERLTKTLRNMPDDGLADLAEADNTLDVNCQFCSRKYTVPLSEVLADTPGA